jgi:hypothetical protein
MNVDVVFALGEQTVLLVELRQGLVLAVGLVVFNRLLDDRDDLVLARRGRQGARERQCREDGCNQKCFHG